MKDEDEDEEQGDTKEDSPPPEAADPHQEFNLTEVIDLTANTIANGMHRIELDCSV